VPPCSFSGPRGIFKRQKILQGPISEFLFYKDQNSTGPYLQGPMYYLSLIKIKFNTSPKHLIVDNTRMVRKMKNIKKP